MIKKSTFASCCVLLALAAPKMNACTSIVVPTQDGNAIYGRTMEWGAYDFHSNLVLNPRKMSTTSKLGNGLKGLTWKNEFGFVAINVLNKPFYTDGMNETGLTVGVLYFPGFSRFQDIIKSEADKSINSVDLAPYILGRFQSVQEIKEALPKIRVIRNEEVAKAFGAPAPLHLVVVDNSGASIVIEYIKGKLSIFDNKVGVMTNSPSYDWQVLNLRNYPQLKPYGGHGYKEINGVSLKPFGAGSGMIGLPGDVTPVSRFVRAVAFTASAQPIKTTAKGINEVARILNNFDIPKGLVREGKSKSEFHINFTQWTTMGDVKNKRYYWWTEFNRRMRVVDLSEMDFTGTKTVNIPLDEKRVEDLKIRTNDFPLK
ncbi:MAG: choloylglycine hydrolase family protein [Lentisphaeria bacterium]|nr:choloylglycine hydrolase family protein [Lentisphaeria bacterium]